MMPLNRTQIIGGVVALVAAVSLIVKKQNERRLEFSSDAAEAEQMMARHKTKIDGVTAPPKASSREVQRAIASAGEVAPAAPFAYYREVAVYAQLKSKVFLSDDEKAQKNEMFANRELIEGIGEFLRRPAGTQFEAQAQQSAALDFLLEALTSKEGNQAAEMALREIIVDDQIETDKLDIDSRKNLAGVKAEVLYQWTSLDPGRTSEIRGWLPGPVSEKIWRNVTDTQQRNLRESAMVGMDDL